MGTTFRKKQAVTDAQNSKMEEVFRRAEAKRCSSDRCTNQAQNGGVCMRHGAKGKRKKCVSDGRTKFAFRGGMCRRHGRLIAILPTKVLQVRPKTVIVLLEKPYSRT